MIPWWLLLPMSTIAWLERTVMRPLVLTDLSLVSVVLGRSAPNPVTSFLSVPWRSVLDLGRKGMELLCASMAVGQPYPNAGTFAFTCGE